jgi:hypothetical protein
MLFLHVLALAMENGLFTTPFLLHHRIFDRMLALLPNILEAREFTRATACIFLIYDQVRSPSRL